MTATSHALIGTVIAAKIGNPALAIPLAIASHIAADMVPHWDELLYRKEKGIKRVLIDSAVDGLLALSLSYSLIVFLFPKTDLLYWFVIIFFSELPDLLLFPYLIFEIKVFKWAYDLGKATNRELDKPWGVITQVLVVGGIIVLGKLL